jgi:hypothetical protein
MRMRTTGSCWLALLLGACGSSTRDTSEDAGVLSAAGDAAPDGAAHAMGCGVCIPDLSQELAERCQVLDQFDEDLGDWTRYTVAVDRGSVFYTSGASVRSYDLARGEARVIANTLDYESVVADAEFVYFGGAPNYDDPWSLYKAPRAGGVAEVLLTDLRTVVGLQREGDRLWFVDASGTTPSRILAVPLTAGSELTTWQLDGPGSLAFHVDDRTLYYASTTFFSRPLSGSAPASELIRARVSNFALSADEIFWGDLALFDRPIFRSSKLGGQPVPIGTAPYNFHPFAQDERFVYLSDTYFTGVMRLAKDGPANAPAETLFELNGAGAHVAIDAGVAYVLCGPASDDKRGSALLRIRL